MKKVVTWILALTMIATLAACGGGDSTGDTSNPTASVQTNSPQTTEPAPTPSVPEIEFVSEEYQVYTDVFDDPTATYLAEIKNPSDTAIHLSNISLDLEHPDGTLIKTVSLLTVKPRTIPAGGTGYICDEIYNTSLDGEITLDALTAAVPKLHYSMDPVTDASEPTVELSQVSAKDEFGHVGMIGKIKNTGSETYSNLFVAAPVRDANGKLLTVILGSVADLAPDVEKGFDGVAFAGRPISDISAVTLEAFAYE